ncbi:hypothetical protein HPB49_010458 [Dermacentor silvarum]|uniref:Uncharacterized protein n=1 Tax=Dermacentor silvarum TaxID=543639 RepID=A0ACB8DPK9_DERSI|nr:hypothetical protein HPB49_010458 [Dermacentor silvarum]
MSSPTSMPATPTRSEISLPTHQRPTFMNTSRLNSSAAWHCQKSRRCDNSNPQNSPNANLRSSSATCVLSRATWKSRIPYCEHFGFNDFHRMSRQFCRLSLRYLSTNLPGSLIASLCPSCRPPSMLSPQRRTPQSLRAASTISIDSSAPFNDACINTCRHATCKSVVVTPPRRSSLVETTAVTPDRTGVVEATHNQEGVLARNSQRTTAEVHE